MSAKDIALVYGVPSQIIGIPDSQTYSNFAEAKLALYNETIIPLLDRVQSDLNEWLSPQFGEDLELRYNIDSIPAMAEQRKRVFESVTQGVQNDFNAIKLGIATMVSITIRNLNDDIKSRLRIRAARQGHSMEQEAKQYTESTNSFRSLILFVYLWRGELEGGGVTLAAT